MDLTRAKAIVADLAGAEPPEVTPAARALAVVVASLQSRVEALESAPSPSPVTETTSEPAGSRSRLREALIAYEESVKRLVSEVNAATLGSSDLVALMANAESLGQRVPQALKAHAIRLQWEGRILRERAISTRETRRNA